MGVIKDQEPEEKHSYQSGDSQEVRTCKREDKELLLPAFLVVEVIPGLVPWWKSPMLH